MKTATVRDLRTRFPFLETWLRAGEEIAVTKHGKTIARLVPEPAARTVVFPDLAAHFRRQRREIWGKRVWTRAEVEAIEATEREGREHT